MGWTVLYIAFGVVAVWLLGEVLLQYKARLRWRLLAFAGFSTVVVGVVALSSVVVITLGAMAFAVGQTFVTLSYRRGFSTGWALGGMPGSSRRRREGGEPLEGEDADPVLEVSGLEEHRPGAGGDPDPGDHPEYVQQGQDPYGLPAYEPQPMPDETGEYGLYDRGDGSPYAPAAAHQDGQGQSGDYGDGYGYGYGQEYGHGYGHEEQHQYAPYSDPYIGYDTGQYAPAASYDPYGAGGGYGPQDGYAGGGYGGGQDAYGGAWVPQQRESEQQPAAATEQPYPYQDPYGGGYATGGYGGGYGDQPFDNAAFDNGYGYASPYAEAGYATDGYGNGYDAQGYDTQGQNQGYGAQGYEAAPGGYTYDEQRGY